MDVARQIHAYVGDALGQVERMLEQVLSETEGLGARTSLHLLKAGGKRVRPLVTLLSGRVFGAADRDVIPIAAAAEMIHMATLVHDDVIDHADTRRGRPTVNAVWGNYPAVLTGDFMLARAMSLIVDQGHPRVLKVMSDMIYEMCEGEIAQHEAKGRLDLTEEEYLRRIGKKTARFFQACAESGALLGGATPAQVRAMGQFGYFLGMAFQVVDDLLDLTGEAPVLGKPVGSDLMEGVLTLPVIHMLQHPRYRDQLLSRLRAVPPPPDDMAAIVHLIRQNGALRYTEEVAQGYVLRAMGLLAELPATEATRLLAEMVVALGQRKS
ncbi:polyprenyl synthetase family protein [Carboxydochorda subterranea]|uniref:Polyprenyl synthetase family protein n=1 Tax=Carboxydichorda subterranea TaxID=3109565 RepID=A0ABZ1BVA3_9FIRM|nr:polyprenyl synthetase family protein [Limnochorda sp. L945t]WRP16719.1 polyprenyl synthetase family protein [Limnochorda sp. L945t]